MRIITARASNWSGKHLTIKDNEDNTFQVFGYHDTQIGDGPFMVVNLDPDDGLERIQIWRVGDLGRDDARITLSGCKFSHDEEWLVMCPTTQVTREHRNPIVAAAQIIAATY